MNPPVSDTPLRSKATEFAELDDGTVVLLDIESGRYYEFDPVGSRIWKLLEDSPSMTQLRDALTAEFDVDDATCLDDLADFLGRLAELGLVGAAAEGGRVRQ